MMTAVLIDDEKQNLNNLRSLLATYCPEVAVLGTAMDAVQGKSKLLEYKPDLLFLDIQMPGQNGFDLLRELNEHEFEVIFVTAYDQYAIQAMRFAAVDYLMKPIDIEELKSAVGRATGQRLLKAENRQLKNLLTNLNKGPKSEQRITLSVTGETRFVKTGEIVRCESSNNYTTFFLEDRSELLVCKPIYEYEEILKDHGFIRCHQSHLVNRIFVKSWNKRQGDILLMTDGAEIPVSRAKKDATKDALYN